MYDKFRKKYRLPAATERLRQQIALEAARRLLDAAGELGAASTLDWLDRTGENDFYVAKRKAAAVLGHRVRPGDLPSDSEVRDQLVTLWRSRRGQDDGGEEPAMPEPAEGEGVVALAEHLDRFAVYRMRLVPLEAVKQNPKFHPEGDVLYHSLQVFHLRARRGPMMRNSCLRPCCTTWARPLTLKIILTPGSRPCAGPSPSGRSG